MRQHSEPQFSESIIKISDYTSNGQYPAIFGEIPRQSKRISSFRLLCLPSHGARDPDRDAPRQTPVLP
ncbi:hypothetical protein L499_A0917 [Bordetella holmesii CDC-H635-BH]|uniref:Uncharacterized protein n=2 Tax=Bordetella holmesii TaxID=35814 RepID=A0A158LZZ4_9BORD|nr:hypothetical protein D560_3111 [Bordetella holmesii ATCC 51541]AIT27735.1 hypothetical protein D558_3089 [Bordetella holmesii 44057]EWM40508.1 hypothetical protein D555_3147 [Bordetella holmesii 35009]EWM43945.1 hypothetical protein D556_3086 [Bordetella holmesii 41130]EXX93752.1 hypothetical protein D559_1155 [Bordetella holmesii 1058]KAK74085.1 hypothetical protein L573_0602 [Bordetella holmesii H620]KAK81178.1 hypothetical protein L503_0908 [Bordetella holmesii CDC-H809-BH]KAK81592.1 h